MSWCRVCGRTTCSVCPRPELQDPPYPGLNEKTIAAAKPSPPVASPEISLDGQPSVRPKHAASPDHWDEIMAGERDTPAGGVSVLRHPETLALRVAWGSTIVPVGELIFSTTSPGVRAHRRETSAPRSSLKGPTSDRPGDPGGVPQVEAFITCARQAVLGGPSGLNPRTALLRSSSARSWSTPGVAAPS